MSTETLMEQRLASVDQAVRDLQRQMAARAPASNWLERITGSMKNEPAFAEVLEYGRAIRQADSEFGDG